MMTNLLTRVCGVFRLFVFCEGSKMGTILLQMCMLMTNMGLIITVKQQEQNILFWWPCISGKKAQTSVLQVWLHSNCSHYQKKSVFESCWIYLCTATASPPGAGDSRNKAIKLKLKTSKEHYLLVLISVIKNALLKQINRFLLVCNVHLMCLWVGNNSMSLCGAVCQYAAYTSMWSRWQLKTSHLMYVIICPADHSKVMARSTLSPTHQHYFNCIVVEKVLNLYFTRQIPLRSATYF